MRYWVKKEGQMAKIWEGRIKRKTDKAVEGFTSSIDVDKSLYLYDITGTAAHSIGLNNIGIISGDELDRILDGLKEIKKKIEEDKIRWDEHEDIHSLVENELKNVIGDLNQKIHTARSRNDQVVLDEKLFLKDAILVLAHELLDLQENLVKIAEAEIDLAIPAFTHLQKAQPVLLSHYLLSFFDKFERDLDRLFQDFEGTDLLPLGGAACAGSGYRINRKLLKEILRFKGLSSNSMDIAGSRDYIIDFTYACAMIMLHLSRLAEDLIIFNSSEFSFLEIDESFCTGSSIMPQKKNPDVLELVRGKSAVVMGNLFQLMALVKNLPSTYNRDLQEDKKIFFGAYHETAGSIEIFSKLLEKIKFNKQAIKEDLKNGFMEATDLADYLVGKGLAFRKSHNIVGRIIRYCIENNINTRDLKIGQLKEFSPLFEEDVYEKIEIEACIDSKDVDCGTNKDRVASSIRSAKARIKNNRDRSTALSARIAGFDEVIKYKSQTKNTGAGS